MDIEEYTMSESRKAKILIILSLLLQPLAIIFQNKDLRLLLVYTQPARTCIYEYKFES